MLRRIFLTRAKVRLAIRFGVTSRKGEERLRLLKCRGRILRHSKRPTTRINVVVRRSPAFKDRRATRRVRRHELTNSILARRAMGPTNFRQG